MGKSENRVTLECGCTIIQKPMSHKIETCRSHKGDKVWLDVLHRKAGRSRYGRDPREGVKNILARSLKHGRVPTLETRQTEKLNLEVHRNLEALLAQAIERATASGISGNRFIAIVDGLKTTYCLGETPVLEITTEQKSDDDDGVSVSQHYRFLVGVDPVEPDPLE